MSNKVYTTSETKEFDYIVNYASALPSGYGHKKITVRLQSTSDEYKNFESVTNNMYDYDKACELEGQEKYEALFELIEYNVESKIFEWLSSLE